MALHGSQKKFDKNKDGKLSAGEWQSWYFATYGVDMEREERRKKSREIASWNDRLGQMMYAARSAAESVLGAAQRLLPNRADAKELAWKAMLCQITAALKEGTEWKIAWKTHVGQMVSNSVVYPVQAVARDLMEVSGLFVPKEAQRMALPCRVLFQEEGELAQARPCGTFWREIILRLPPYDKEHPPEFQNGSLSLTLPSDEPGENDALEDALIDLLDGMFQLTTFFGDAESADHDLRGNRLLSCFCGHWQQIRGNYINFADSGVRRMAEQNPALYDEWGVEELSGMYSHEVLEELYPKRPELAIALWRSLAEQDQPFSDPDEMENFLGELDWLWQSEGEELEQLRPLVKVLKEDEEFVWQLYCGPVINACQWTILKGAMCCGELELAGQLFALLEEHPLGRENAPCFVLEERIYRSEPELTIAIWRFLAGTDEPLDDPEEARRFLDGMEWLWQAEYENGDAEQLRPLLDELQRDDGFARQICQSACVSYAQQSLIMAAADCGKFALAEHLLSLLTENPLPRDRWDLDFEELRELTEKLDLTGEKSEDEPEDEPEERPRDDTEYVYCKVHIPGVRRDYSYLAGELPLDMGDWVKVPFGRKDAVKRGSVVSVARYTRRTAPWPLEETKTVLGMAEQPTEGEAVEKEPVAPEKDKEPKTLVEQPGRTMEELETGPENEPEEKPKDEHPQDDTEYVYCKVYVPGACRDYAYLAGEFSLHVGDWVKVPFGMENVVKRGKVTSVTRCTRQTAPWPPEQTKTVLCMTEQPTEFEEQWTAG